MMFRTIETPADFLAIRAEPFPTVKAGKRVIPIPCLNTLLVKSEMVVGNTYNPNSVPADKMNLLRQSILDNGFCFPIVTIWDDDQELFVIVDGFHRRMMGDKKWLNLSHVPVVCLHHDVRQRMAATVQFNKARGVHQVDLDADVIRALLQQGMNEDEISEHLGIDTDTIHRYKQLTGIADLFKNAKYSTAWDVVDD